MDKLNFIESIFSLLKASDVSFDDLVAYRKNQKKEQSSASKLPLEVLYENNYRSFFVEKDKTPVAIICGGIGFAFDDAPQNMDWDDAKAYCNNYSTGGQDWTLPHKEAGHLLLLYHNKEAINKVLNAFGKEPIKKDWYWASGYYNRWAWGMYLCEGSVQECYDKGSSFNVRPVTLI